MTSRSFTWLAVALPMLLACGEDPSCPAGSTKHAGVCVKGDPARADDGQESGDAGADAGDGNESSSEDDGTAMSDGGCSSGLVYVDMDGDGVGAGEAHQGCPGDGMVAVTGDCSPENELVFPGAEEVCNGVDDDCDEDVDEGVAVMLYADVDGDGHGDQFDLGEKVCAGQAVPGKVESHDDCDDDCAACSPDNSAETACDGKDENCDGTPDEGMTTPYFLDCDGDGYLPQEPRESGACARPAAPVDCGAGKWFLEGEQEDGVDCSDEVKQAHPGSTYAGAAPVTGTDGYDYDCDTVEEDAGTRCVAILVGSPCNAVGHECFLPSTSAACGEEANTFRCAPSGMGTQHVWTPSTKRWPCR